MAEGGWSSGSWGEAAWGFSVYERDQADSARVSENAFVASNTFRPAILESGEAVDLSVVVGSTYRSFTAETARPVDAVDLTGIYRVATQDTVRATQDRFSAQQIFNTRNLETTTIRDIEPTAQQVFTSAVDEQTTAFDLVEAQFRYDADFAEQAQIREETFPTSTFRVQQTDTARGTDTMRARQTFRCTLADKAGITSNNRVNGIFYVRVEDTVRAQDLLVGRYLWELIENNQTLNWQNTNSNVDASWIVSDTDTSTMWDEINTAP